MRKTPWNMKDLLAPRSLAVSGLVAAAYAVVTVLFAPISYGHIQVRISEASRCFPSCFPRRFPGFSSAA